MQHIGKFVKHRFAQVAMLTVFLALIGNVAGAQTPAPSLAFYPSQTTLVAGAPQAGPSGVSIPSTANYIGPAAGLVPPTRGTGFGAVAMDAYGNLYIAEGSGDIIFVMASGNGPIPVLSNSSQPNYVASPQAGYVYAVAGTGLDSNGNADLGSGCTPAPGVIDNGGDGCFAAQAIFGTAIKSIAVDSKGNLYVADYTQGVIREVYGGNGNVPGQTSPTTGYIYSIAGTYGLNTASTSVDGTQAIGANIGEPEFIAIDGNGSIYFYELRNLVLRVVANGSVPNISNPNAGAIYTMTGPKTLTATDGVQATTSKLTAPLAIATDSFDNIYIGDGELRVIYVGGTGNSVPGLNGLQTGYIYKVAGKGTSPTKGFAPQGATSVGISPSGIAIDATGNIYITGSGLIDRIDPLGNLSAIYGNNSDGQYSCAAPADLANDGCASDERSGGSYTTGGIAVDVQGNVYLTDGGLLQELNVSGASLYFTPSTATPAQPQQPIMIYNAGNAPLMVSSVQITSGPFTVSTLGSSLPTGVVDCTTTPLTLAPGASCEASVALSPSYTGTANVTATGMLTVTSDSKTGTTNTIQLIGESAASVGLSPTALNPTSPNYLPNSATAGAAQSVEYSLVNHGASTATAGGTVTLYNGNTPIPGQTQTMSLPFGRGNVTFSNLIFPTGNNFVYAIYSGDSNYAGSQSVQQLITIAGTASTTTLSQFTAPVATGSSVSLTATVSIASGATPPTGESAPIGSVTFKSGGTVLCTTGTISGGTASCTTTPTAFATAGIYPITAVYSGDNYFNASMSMMQSLTVQAPVSTITTVGASLLSIGLGSSTNLFVTVAGTSGTTAPTGSVQFYYALNGGSTISIGGAQTLAAGSTSGTSVAALNGVTSLPEGADSITAVYTPSSSLFTAMPSNAVTVTVGAPATITTLQNTPTSITYGQSVTLTAQVMAQVGNTAPTGSVDFTVGSTDLGSVALNSNGVATLTGAILPGGSGTVTDQVIATYSGATTPPFASSISTVASVSVIPLTTSTTVSYSPLSPTAGQAVMLTAMVSAGSGNPTPNGGTVNFYNNGTLIGPGALVNGTATLSTTFSPAGTETITATFAGGGGFSGSSTSSTTSIVVTAPPATTMTSLISSVANLTTGQSVTFTATVANTSGTGTPNGQVTFLNGSTQLGTTSLNSQGQATLTLTPSAATTYHVTVQYQGNTNFTGSSSSPAVTVTVMQALAQSSTALSITPSSAVQQGTSVTFTATVASASTSSTITPTGTVTFYNAGQQIPNSTSTLNGGIATFSSATLNAGTYSVTAQYSGDANYSGSSSPAAPLTVGAPTPSFALIATPNNLTLTSGQDGKAIITLTPTYSYTGTVTLSCGTLPSNVTCSFSPATLTADGKNDAVQSTLTITTDGMTAEMRNAPPSWRGRSNAALSAALFFLPVGLLGFGLTDKRKRLGRYLSLAILAFVGTGLLTLSGCAGGNGGSTNDAAKGVSQITVTGTGSAGSQTQTANIAITIQ